MKKLVLIILLIFAVSVLGQKDKGKVEVKLNLLVADLNQKFIPIDDIKVEDLKLFEDGIEQKITYFQKKTSANIGFVIDNTGSMRSQLEMIITIATTLSDSLRDSDEAFVVRFVSSDKIEVIEDWTNNKKKLQRAFANMYSEGGQSAILDAIFKATSKIDEKNKDETKRKVIVVISDFEDRDSIHSQKEVFDHLKLKNVQLFTIGLLNELPKEKGFLASSPNEKSKELASFLANQTNSRAFFPKYSMKDHKEIIDAIRIILYEIQSQYEISYISTNQNRKNSERKIVVEVVNDAKGEKRQVFVRDKVLIPKE